MWGAWWRLGETCPSAAVYESPWPHLHGGRRPGGSRHARRRLTACAQSPHCLAFPQCRDQPFEFCTPEGMVGHRTPRRFDEHRAQLTTTLLGDGTSMVGLTRGMDAGYVSSEVWE